MQLSDDYERGDRAVERSRELRGWSARLRTFAGEVRRATADSVADSLDAMHQNAAVRWEMRQRMESLARAAIDHP